MPGKIGRPALYRCSHCKAKGRDLISRYKSQTIECKKCGRKSTMAGWRIATKVKK